MDEQARLGVRNLFIRTYVTIAVNHGSSMDAVALHQSKGVQSFSL